MLIAVIEEAFSRAQEDLRAHREDDKLLQSFQSQVKNFKKFTGGKLSNLGHMVRSRSGSKFKRGSGKSTEITNPLPVKRKMSFGSLIGKYLSEGASIANGSTVVNFSIPPPSFKPVS